jgi:hypothetical protein
MRLRSSILVACMLVVPALAMFSHKVPAGARRQLRQSLWEPLGAVLADAVGLGGGTAEAVPRQAPPDGAAIPAVTGPVAPAEAPRAAAIEPIFAAPPPADPPPQTVPGIPTTTPGPVGDAATVRAGEPLADRAALEATLRACGATEVEWGQDGEGDGLHRCSCRMPAGPTGQLQRVFQASGTDAIGALRALVGQVTEWSSRHGSAAAAGPAARRNR